MNFNSEKSKSDEPDAFYFESDQLALRDNKDYRDTIKTLLVLCAQRKQAIEDYNTCVEFKKDALENPEKIVNRLINGETFGLPEMFTVPNLPVIDWSQYSIKVPESVMQSIYSKNVANTKNHITEELLNKKEPQIRNHWTVEEQRRLEELLQIYPPEAIEFRRYKKIADALGNRTIQQVSSRIQKYFLKLYKAGMPIPGRIPKSADKYKRNYTHKYHRRSKHMWKPTTFFPSLCIPVEMNDADAVPGPSVIKQPLNVPENTFATENYLMPNNSMQNSNVLVNDSKQDASPLQLQLGLLYRIKQEKLLQNSINQPPFNHIGFKCDYCDEEPITGGRWHCASCISDSIDFCSDCMLTQMYSDQAHSLLHRFECYIDAETTLPTTVDNVDKQNVYSAVENQQTNMKLDACELNCKSLNHETDQFDENDSENNDTDDDNGNDEVSLNNASDVEMNTVYTSEEDTNDGLSYEEFHSRSTGDSTN